MTASVAEYMRYEHQLKEQEVMYERKSRIISISLLVLIMALICIIAILKNISQRKEIEKNMILASSLRQMLLVKETEVSKMRVQQYKNSSRSMMILMMLIMKTLVKLVTRMLNCKMLLTTCLNIVF